MRSPLNDIAAFEKLGAIEGEFRWRVDYLTRGAVFYQFGCECHRQVQSGTGHRLDAANGHVSLPLHQVVPALVDFQANETIAFYCGSNTSISTVAQGFGRSLAGPAEIVLIEIQSHHDEFECVSAARTRLAFIGLLKRQVELLSGFTNTLNYKELLHPNWFRERYEPMPRLPRSLRPEDY